jgi:hypothetical protein
MSPLHVLRAVVFDLLQFRPVDACQPCLRFQRIIVTAGSVSLISAAGTGRWRGYYPWPNSAGTLISKRRFQSPSTHTGMLVVSRHWLLVIGVVAATAVTCGGCRSCSNCHDYDPPVANCDCNASGCHRAGSASGGYESEGYATEEYVVEPPMDDSNSQDADNQDTQVADELQTSDLP